jgi:hypothetical protein
MNKEVLFEKSVAVQIISKKCRCANYKEGLFYGARAGGGGAGSKTVSYR